MTDFDIVRSFFSDAEAADLAHPDETLDASDADLALARIESDRSILRDAERKRCTDIVKAARFGEIDGDLRSLIYRIESGDAFPDPIEVENAHL